VNARYLAVAQALEQVCNTLANINVAGIDAHTCDEITKATNRVIQAKHAVLLAGRKVKL